MLLSKSFSLYLIIFLTQAICIYWTVIHIKTKNNQFVSITLSLSLWLVYVFICISHISGLGWTFNDMFSLDLYWRHLSVEKNRVLFVKLYPEVSNLTRENPPIASFIIRVVCSAGDRKALTHPGKMKRWSFLLLCWSIPQKTHQWFHGPIICCVFLIITLLSF